MITFAHCLNTRDRPDRPPTNVHSGQHCKGRHVLCYSACEPAEQISAWTHTTICSLTMMYDIICCYSGCSCIVQNPGGLWWPESPYIPSRPARVLHCAAAPTVTANDVIHQCQAVCPSVSPCRVQFSLACHETPAGAVTSNQCSLSPPRDMKSAVHTSQDMHPVKARTHRIQQVRS